MASNGSIHFCDLYHLFIWKDWSILASMRNRVLILFVLLSVVSGVVSGTPLHSPNDKMMKCCDKAKSKDASPSAEAARLCCATNCSNSVPISSSGSFNFTPSNLTFCKSIAGQIATLFPVSKTKTSVAPQYLRKSLPSTFQPKYLQYHSFLI